MFDRLRAYVNAAGGRPDSGAGSIAFAFGGLSASGQRVTDDTVTGISTAFRCAEFLSNSVAQLPVKIRSIGADGSRSDDRGAIWTLLAHEPNPFQTSVEFRKLMQTWLAFRGNAYAVLETSPDGRLSLWPVHPDFMQPAWSSASRYLGGVGRDVVYHWRPDGQKTERVFFRGEVLHLKGLSLDGLSGISVITAAKETFGLARAAENHGSKLFGQGAMPSGIISPKPGVRLKSEQATAVKETIRNEWSGPKNAGRVLYLSEPFDFTAATMTSEDVQFLQTRRFQAVEICRWFGVPPHLVYELDRATFSNIEHQSIEVVVHTLTPWLRIWEQALERLLFPGEAGSREIRFEVKGLLRGDYRSRMEGYQIARQNGLMSANEARELEDDEPYAGGDSYHVMSNLATVNPDGTLTQPSRPKEP